MFIKWAYSSRWVEGVLIRVVTHESGTSSWILVHRRWESRGDILVRVRSLPLASETLAVSSFERIVVENVFLANNRMKFLKANR